MLCYCRTPSGDACSLFSIQAVRGTFFPQDPSPERPNRLSYFLPPTRLRPCKHSTELFTSGIFERH
jgi:hypothetical protein